RHTRSTRDWSSDVCSSDLDAATRAELESQLKAGMSAEAVKKAMADVRGNQARAAVAQALASDANVRSVLSRDLIRQALDDAQLQIGRASCRDRVERWRCGG